MRGKLNGWLVFAISANSCQGRHSDPRPAILIFPANQNGPWAKGACTAGLISQAGADASLLYARLIVSRYSQKLLEAFQCAVRGITALDPIGWNGPRQPLCARCADPL